MDILVKVLAQYHDENGKPKGGQYLDLRVDEGYLMYDKKLIVETIEEMLAELSETWAGTFTYLEHELVFSEPIELKKSIFQDKIERIFNETEKV